MPKYYPINLNLENKKCIVIGGGNVAERKAKRLLDCGADVRLISPDITQGLRKLADSKKIQFTKKHVTLKDINGAYLVISAANDRDINSSVYSYCRRKNILINVVDSPDECDFILPSIVEKGDLTISISTGGVSPALSKKIRQDLEKKFGIEYPRFLKIMKRLRPKVIQKIKSQKERKLFFERAIKSDIFDLLKKNKSIQAKQKLERILQND